MSAYSNASNPASLIVNFVVALTPKCQNLVANMMKTQHWMRNMKGQRPVTPESDYWQIKWPNGKATSHTAVAAELAANCEPLCQDGHNR